MDCFLGGLGFSLRNSRHSFPEFVRLVTVGSWRSPSRRFSRFTASSTGSRRISLPRISDRECSTVMLDFWLRWSACLCGVTSSLIPPSSTAARVSPGITSFRLQRRFHSSPAKSRLVPAHGPCAHFDRKMRRIVRRTLHPLGNDDDVNEGTMRPLPITQTAKMVEPAR